MLLPALARAKEQGLKASCLGNTRQISIGMILYADDNRQIFPDPGNPASPTWWNPGPFHNSLGLLCGGEWMCTIDGKSYPNTPAPMIEPYLRNPLVWVCAKRKRGLTYTTAPGIFDPTITGFLSYGFNEIGCFCLCNPAGGGLSEGMYVPTPPFKYTAVKRPAQLIAVTEVSGLNNPLDCDGNGGGNVDADAAWLDGVWDASSGPGSQPNNNFNGRLQTAYGRHDNQVDIIYVDGHSESSLPSKLTWGLFWGYYDSSAPSLIAAHQWNQSISTTAYDSKVWTNTPE